MIKSENQTNQLLQQKITDLLSHKDVIPLFAEQIIDVLEMSEDEENSLQEILNQMVRTGKLVQTKKKKYALPEDLGFLTGRLQGNARGFGFFISDKDEDDVFISAENLNGAMHNDRIMIRLLGSKGPSREGKLFGFWNGLTK